MKSRWHSLVSPLVTGLSLLLLAAPSLLSAGDWPQWRYDASRSAAAPHAAAADLHRHWSRVFPAPRPAWPPQRDDGDKLQFDLSHQLVVHRGLVLVTSAANDCLYAIELDSGRERWRFYADGPFRVAAAAAAGRVYAAADDGRLYCLEADTGRELWRFEGAPGPRRVLGNGRLISAWPARGGPVVAGDTVYFTAGLFPFMGTFIYALDAADGRLRWENSSSGSVFIRQVHGNSGSFAGIAPQGYLALAGERLLVAGGRSRPAIYRRDTGEFLDLDIGARPAGKAPPWQGGPVYGGYEVIAGEENFFVHGEMLRLADGGHIDFLGQQALSVLGPGGLYGVIDDQVVCHDPAPTAEEVTVTDARGRTRTSIQYPPLQRWSAPAPAGLERLHLQAGEELFGSGPGGRLYRLALTGDEKRIRLAWEATLPGEIWTMAVAGGRLLVMTREGVLHVFGPGEREPLVHQPESVPLPAHSFDPWSAAAARLLADGEPVSGWVLVVGLRTGRLVEALLATSTRRVIALDPDPARTAALRQRLDRAGLYGDRAAVLTGTLAESGLPPYFADLVVSEDPAAAGLETDLQFAARLFQLLRPYGGRVQLALDRSRRPLFLEQVREAGLVHEHRARLGHAGEETLLVREGPLPGAGWWTHQNADATNTGISPDEIARAPLGLLWFGGPSNDHVLPRHGRGPVPQVAGGRLFLLGPDTLQARDVYTGRQLWLKELPGIGAYYDTTAHQPGADHVGSPFVSLPEAVYVAFREHILRLDPASGAETARFPAPADPETGRRPPWGFLAVEGDFLIGGLDPQLFDERRPGARNWNAISSRHLVIMDRADGRVLWRRTADWGFRHNAIIAAGERLFVLDRMPGEVREHLVRRGEAEPPPSLLCLSLADGTETWRRERDNFGTWLGYSRRHDILLQSGRPAVDGRQGLPGEPGDRLAAFRGRDGVPLWARQVEYRNAPLIHDENIFVFQRAFCLFTGEDRQYDHPLTGETIPWRYRASANCGQIIGSTHLLTFRHRSASYYDLAGEAGTGSLGGFRSGCTPNLVPADGVLNAPDYTRTCICSYQLQTSLALVPMADVESWKANVFRRGEQPVRRGGINLGAPGDRRLGDRLWLAWPPAGLAGGTSPEVPPFSTGASGATGEVVPVTVSPEFPAWTRFQVHPSRVRAGEAPPVAASGLAGAFTLRVSLVPGAGEGGDHRYNVRLHFLEPDGAVTAGARVFSVTLQGREVIGDLDVHAAAGGSHRALVREFSDIAVDGDLVITLDPAPGSDYPPLLAGVEFSLAGEN